MSQHFFLFLRTAHHPNFDFQFDSHWFLLNSTSCISLTMPRVFFYIICFAIRRVSKKRSLITFFKPCYSCVFLQDIQFTPKHSKYETLVFFLQSRAHKMSCLATDDNRDYLNHDKACYCLCQECTSHILFTKYRPCYIN